MSGLYWKTRSRYLKIKIVLWMMGKKREKEDGNSTALHPHLSRGSVRIDAPDNALLTHWPSFALSVSTRNLKRNKNVLKKSNRPIIDTNMLTLYICLHGIKLSGNLFVIMFHK